MNRLGRLALIILTVLVVDFVAGQPVNYSDSLRIALDLATGSDDKISTLNALATEMVSHDLDEALGFAQRAYQLAESSNDNEELLKAFINLGTIQWSRGEYLAAMEYATQARDLAENLSSDTGLAQAIHLLGLIYTDLGNFTKSSEYFFKSLELYREMDDKEGVSKTLNTIGVIYFEQNNYDKALEYFFEALQIAQDIDFTDGVARGLNNVAIVFEAREEYENANQYFEKAVLINRELGKAKGEGINYLNLGITNKALQNYDRAIFYFEEALQIFDKLQHKQLIAKTKNFIGEYYTDTHRYDLAEKYASEALAEAREINSKAIAHKSAELLHNLFLIQQDTIKAYKWAIIQGQLHDSLNIDESKTELSKLEMLNNFNQQEKERKIAQQRKDFIIIIIIILLFFSLLVILLIYARQRSKARATRLEKQSLEDKLEFRDKELTTNVIYLMKKNELLSKISSQLIDLEKTAIKDETKAALHRIAVELKKSKQSDVWEEFEFRFNQVHESFYKKLTQKYPDLTANDLRICAFLKLNLTTKEIAEITGQRAGTIEMTRTRLRKKLGIAKTNTDIVNFLSRI